MIKSLSGKQCLSSCHKKGEYSLHPITLQHVTSKQNYCHVHPYMNDGKFHSVDDCDIKTNKTIETNYMDIQTAFDSEIFLFSIYYIKSLGECFIWANDNKDKHIKTVNRVVECGLKTWYNALKDNIDEIIVIAFKDYVSIYYDKKIDYKTSKNILNKYYTKYNKSQNKRPLRIIEKILNVI
jgi:hypothetical protein